MFLRKSVGIANLIIVWNDVCSEEIDNHSICNSEGYASPKGTIYQDVFIYIKFFISMSRLDYIYIKICTHVKQEFNIRIKIYVHVSRSACEYIKSNKYWSTSPYTDPQNTRRNATLRSFSQSIFLRKEIAPLRKVVDESACYTSIDVFDTKRRTTWFKVRKALNNKFVFLQPVKYIEIRCLLNLLPALSCAKEIDRDPKLSESPRKIDSIHQNDSIVATRARAVATKIISN